jgi:hypothetical protein
VKHPTPPPNPAVAEAGGSRLSITKPADGDFAPHSRFRVTLTGVGRVLSWPILGGLHHQYVRVCNIKVANPRMVKISIGAFRPLTGNTEPMIDETSGTFRLLSGRRTGGRRHGRRLELFAPLVARCGLKNVPTHIEIIAELLACHAGAVTKSGASFAFIEAL